MKEPRFIELLNLYVDQQLSPQEAAELEVEIQQNPARRRTYQQYCRMQKGCALLFEHERTTAPASTALARAMAEADRKIVNFPEEPQRRSFWTPGYSVAAIAAAACVAWVLVLQTNTSGPVSRTDEVAKIESAATPVDLAAIAPTIIEEPKTVVARATATDEFKPIFTVQTLRSDAVKPEGLFISVSKEDARLLEWTHQVQLKPLRKVSLEEFAFNVRAADEKPLTTQLSTLAEGAADDPTAAFTFTK